MAGLLTVLWRVRSTDSGLSGVDEMEKAAFPEYWLRERCLFAVGERRMREGSGDRRQPEEPAHG